MPNENIRLPFLLTDDGSPVRGPYKLAELRQMWAERKMTADTRLFFTWNNHETKEMICANIRGDQIRESLESGTEIAVEAFR